MKSYTKKRLGATMITEFSEKVGIPVSDILGSSRKARLVDARHIYWKKLRDGGFTLLAIAEMCNCSHATVLHGVRKVEELLKMGDVQVVELWTKVENIEFEKI